MMRMRFENENEIFYNDAILIKLVESLVNSIILVILEKIIKTKVMITNVVTILWLTFILLLIIII